ncbi:MAG TPA: LytR C-terminal domain-containing protein [Candidatus Saccharimonadales bacterium]|nr:LytR C-terminal domain-containing protein [Candidatus Saccharimonadales bacterium]
MQNSDKPRRKSQRKIIIGVTILIAVLLLIIGFLFMKYHNLSKDPQAAAKATTRKIVGRVGNLYEIPTDEEPTVAQVQDKDKLAGQPFFAKAQNGDYILVYSKNKLAMIYREKDNKLVNVGPINITANGDPTSAASGQAATAKASVAVLNGSGSGGKLDAAVAKLSTLSDQISIQDVKPDAKNKNTPTTIVFDASGQNPAIARSVAEKVGGKVELAMPNGEVVPNGATIVVIVGKN